MAAKPDDSETRPYGLETTAEGIRDVETAGPTLPITSPPTEAAYDVTKPVGSPPRPAGGSREEETSDGQTPATRAMTRDEAPQPADLSAVRSAALWDTVDASGEFQPGQVIFGRYIVQAKLGRGGMGTVWLVTHRELNTDRALKLIVAGISYDGQARARFRREAQVMAQFVHPNAVIVHDARLTENDVAYIDMEFVQGRSLDRIVRRGEAMPLPWVARVLDQLCDVLEVAHQKGIVHRDLKPANLMLLGDRPEGKEHLKVLDFGIAKILGDVETHGPQTMTGVFMGTPPYASPEQADGKADTRSDIYSVGVILYEFLTGFRPFSGPAARVLVDTLTQPPPPFATINPAVQQPPGLEEVVMRCMAKDPADRPQSAREIAEAFRAALPAEFRDAGAQTVTRIETVSRPVPWLPIALIVALIAVLGGLAGMYLSSREVVVNGGGPGGNGGDPFATALLPVGFEPAPKAEKDKKGRPTTLVPVGEPASADVKLVSIPGGTFLMGDPASPHKQDVPDFAMSETEVTNGQMHAYYKALKLSPPPDFEKAFQKLVTGGSDPRNAIPAAEAERHPAVGVTHDEAVRFAHWLKAELPTQAEWEYAVRSRGLENRPYSWSGTAPIEANSGKASLETLELLPTGTTKVRNYPDDCTDQGVYDLVGNVREWCRDAGAPPTQFAIRGGSYKSFATDYSYYANQFLDGANSTPDLGFRVVVEWPKAKIPKTSRSK